MHYAIYFPGAREPSDKLFRKAGIGNLLRGDTAPVEFAEVVRNGPDGTFGMLATWRETEKVKHGAAPPLSLSPDWEWKPVCANADLELPEKRYWFGIHREHKPTPDDLAVFRGQCFPGGEILLDDGQRWVIPSVTKLPSQIGLNSEGRVEKRVAEQHKWYVGKAWEIAKPVFETIDDQEWLDALSDSEIAASEQTVTVELTDIWEFAVHALALNYRVNQEVVDFLGLLSGTTLLAIVMAAIDFPDISRVRNQKKRAALFEIPVG